MGGGAKPTGPHDLPFVVQWPWRRMPKYVFIVSFAVCREMASADASSHRVILFRPPTQGVGKRPEEAGSECGQQVAGGGVFHLSWRGPATDFPSHARSPVPPGMIPPWRSELWRRWEEATRNSPVMRAMRSCYDQLDRTAEQGGPTL